MTATQWLTRRLSVTLLDLCVRGAGWALTLQRRSAATPHRRLTLTFTVAAAPSTSNWPAVSSESPPTLPAAASPPHLAAGGDPVVIRATGSHLNRETWPHPAVSCRGPGLPASPDGDGPTEGAACPHNGGRHAADQVLWWPDWVRWLLRRPEVAT